MIDPLIRARHVVFSRKKSRRNLYSSFWNYGPLYCLLSGFSLLPAAVHAQAATVPRPLIEERRQQDRERALRQQQEPSIDVRGSSATEKGPARLPHDETPCFVIDRLLLQGESSARFDWILSHAAGVDHDDSPIGRCLGTTGIGTLVARLQAALVEGGYPTTRVLAGPQALSTGTLTLTLLPGRIKAVRPDDGATASTWLRNAIPVTPGDLLELRAIEQGLENLKRLPTADADIQIAPSIGADAGPGDSDLVVRYRRGFPLRATLSLDDSGTRATGRTQIGATVAWDGPLGLNDLAYVSLNHDAFNHDDRGTGGHTLHYSIPFGYGLLGVTASRSRYHQTVAGGDVDYVYAGSSSNAEVRWSQLLHRDRSRKTTAALRAFRRASVSEITDVTTLNAQSRVVGGWEASLNQREFLGDATLDGTLAYRRGTGAFGGAAASEEAFGEGTSRFRLWTAEATLNLPLRWAGQKLRYTALWRAQWNRTPLLPQDQFAIGGRYTVRGFDGETSLLGDRGGLMRNDVGLALGESGAELYVGIDYGQVSGVAAEHLLGHHLVGGAVGLRGVIRGLNYDFFVGAPIRRPEGYRTARTTVGLNLNYSF